MNIDKWHKNYVTDLSLKYNSKSTIKTYSAAVKKFLCHFSYYREPKEIRNQEIKNYLLSFQTFNTRKQALCSIRLFYSLTVGMPNKIKSIPYPKKTKSLPKTIDSEYLIKTISEIPNLKHKAILSTAYSCALRVSELINLKIKDIDSHKMQIHIRNAKGNKDRMVKLSPGLLEILRSYYKKYRPVDYLFEGVNGKYTSGSCNKIVKKYLGQDYSAHVLRHSAATYMLESGTDISLIQKTLGHQSIKTTMIYTHTSNRLLQQVNTPI